MMKTVLYEGEKLVGELEVYLDENKKSNSYELVELLKKGLKIRELSKGGERCHPIAVFHTLSSNGVCFKLIEYKSPLYFQHELFQDTTPLFGLHSTCLRDNKTIVVAFGDEEIHLVAMRSRRMDRRIASFWGFSVAPGLYEACLGMLNLRCLGIVFDLDETLIVANTSRSFEDRIEALQRKLSVETDSQRIAGMMGEIKRYQDDKAILKQYAETDQVVDNGKVHKIQAEVVPALSNYHQTIVRPLIRLQDKNIVLTRINPQIRDTSVLVRLRPAWEDLRSYLTARARKRFEVYVCTMAERDYALEMWRLLDPDSNLINTAEVLDRIVCVKSGSKKSLFNVFRGGICHPKMALVIDDRLKVWDEKDQPRVHVVAAFAPYYAPQAEASNAIPVLCVARNVACNVRGGFFKEFDDVILQRINEVSFEDDLKDVPCSPDVSNYLVSEDDGSGSNANKDPPCFDGMADAEVERRIKEAPLVSTATPSLPSIPSLAGVNLDSRLTSCLPFSVPVASMTIPQLATQTTMTPFPANLIPQAGPLVRPLSSIGHQEMGFHNSPGQEEGEVPESELDPDMRRRLLILKHGHDFRDVSHNEPSFPVRPPQAHATGLVPGQMHVVGTVPGLGPVQLPIPGPGPVPRMQSRGGWFPVDDHMRPGPLGRPVPKEYPIGPDFGHIENQRPPSPFQRRVEGSVRLDRDFPENKRLPREAPRRNDRWRSNHLQPNHQSFKESPVDALRDIGMRVGAKVEFRSGLVPVTELRFFMEVYFSGERIGEGTGVTRKEAQHRAAESALMNLADRYLTQVKSCSSTSQSDTSRGQSPNITGCPSDPHYPGGHVLSKDGIVFSVEPTKSDDSKDSTNPVSVLTGLCTREGLSIDFSAPSPSSTSTIHSEEIYAEVKIDGQLLGKGIGLTCEEAKMQAAENALASPESMLGQFTVKRSRSPRSLEATSSKRLKAEFPQVLQQMPSDNRMMHLSCLTNEFICP